MAKYNFFKARNHFKVIATLLDVFFIPILVFFCLLTRVLRNKRHNSNKNVFMGTMHINNWVYVAKALRYYGYNVDLIVWCPPIYEIGVISYDVVISERFKGVFEIPILRYILQFLFFIWAIFRYDVFIMCFMGRLLDRTVMNRWLEFFLLKLARKKIILNTYGAEIMTPKLSLSSKNYKYSVLSGYREDPYYNSLDENEIVINRLYCQKQADVIISAIDHVEYLDRIDEYFHMRCIDLNSINPRYHTGNSVIRVVHAPNHPKLKGTSYLVRIIDDLKKEGLSLELVILERCDHNRVLDVIRDSDIIADQFLLGSYARFAIEGMAFGKPVLCYLRETLFIYNPIWKECPIVNTSPDSLRNNIKELYFNPSLRINLGKKGRSYVEKYHSLEYVGKRLNNIINNLGK